MLDADQEKDLFERYLKLGDVAARNEIISSHDPLARKAARRAAATSALHFEDYYQEALLALCLAIDKFDPNVGARFSTLASLRVADAIRNYRYSFSRPVRIGTSALERELLRKLPNAVREIEARTGRPITIAGYTQIASQLGIDPKKVIETAWAMSASDVSLSASGSIDTMLGEVDIVPQQLIADDFTRGVELAIDSARISAWSNGLLREMYSRKHLFIALGCLSSAPPQERRAELAKSLNLSIDTIRRTETTALRELIRELRYQHVETALFFDDPRPDTTSLAA